MAKNIKVDEAVTEANSNSTNPADLHDTVTQARATGPNPSANQGSGMGLVGLVIAILALVVGVAALVMQFTRPQTDSSVLISAQTEVAKLNVEAQGLAARIAVLEAASGEGGAAPVTAAAVTNRRELDALRAELGSLRQSVTEFMISAAQVQAVAEAAGSSDTTLSPRVIAVEQGLATLSQRGVATPEDVQQLVQSLAGLETSMNESLAQLDQRLTAVEDTVRRVEEESEASFATMQAQATEDLAQSQQAVQAALADQSVTVTGQIEDARADMVDLRGEMAALQETTSDLSAIVAAQSEKNAASSARLLAVSRLRDALVAGRGVRAEAQAVRLVTANDTTLEGVLDTLDPLIADVVPSLESLQAQYPGLWEKVKLEAALAETADNRLGQVWARTRSLVNIQRVDGEDAIMAMDGVEGQLARINFFVQNARLDEALAQLDKLEGPAAQALADYRANLENRAAYSMVLADLDRWSLARLASDAQN